MYLRMLIVSGWRICALALCLMLAACGGGGGDAANGQMPAASCGLEDNKSWLLGYMQDQYLWYERMPGVDAGNFATVESYFGALLYPGGGVDPAAPDRWSFVETTLSHEQFFREGRTLGYGIAVAGLELKDRPNDPLRIRYIEPKSPAAAAGLQRGDILVSMNGVSSSAIVTRNDFSALTPQAAGDVLQLLVRNAAGDRSVSVVAGVYDLTPVSTSAVLQSPAGRTVAYLLLKDFINQADPQLAAAFSQFKNAGITDLVLDLRYNGGGLVNVARDLASYVGGSQATGDLFAALKFSAKKQFQDNNYTFTQPDSRLDLTRVFILTGQRTCSASELVINGLKPFVNVVQIGDTSCGKPVGFVPVSRCGSTFNAVNFETFNANGAGRYWDGLPPACRVSDEFVAPLGTPDESLLAAATYYADNGVCPPIAAQLSQKLRIQTRGAVGAEPGERQGMWVR